MPDLSTILSMGSEIGGLITGINQAKELLSSFGTVIKGVMDAIVGAAEFAIDGIKRVAQSIMQLSGESSRLDSMRDSFNKMAAEFGAMGQELLGAMREATIGMAKDSGLIQSAMTGMMLISKEAMGDVKKTLPMFAQIATAAARALGEDVGFMFSSLARGIGRASPMILDNLGFTIRLGEVYGNLAKKLGVTVKELDTTQRQTALVAEVMRLGTAYVEKLGISTGGLATAQKQLATEMANLRDVMGQALMPMVQGLQLAYSNIATTVIQKVIPAFHMLGRVFSEVFGTRNPFWRWVEGEFSADTAKRIQDIEANIKYLKDEGADFEGAITAATKIYEESVNELNEQFAPKIAKIQEDLTERIAKIWFDFNLSQTRTDEDNKKEDARRLEDHKEKLKEIEERYTQDISDAIRKRDARALLDLMRNQSKETKSEEAKFEEDRTRKEEDRAIERQRELENAQLREQDAKVSAAKQMAAVGEEYAKGLANIEAARDAAFAVAEATWQATIDGYAATLQTQKELIIKQIQEEAKLKAEMEKPLPPFWQKLKDILVPIWEDLQRIKDIIIAIVEAPTIGNILVQLGIAPEQVDAAIAKFEELKTKLGEISDAAGTKFEEVKIKLGEIHAALVEIGGDIVTIFGPTFAAIWGDLGEAIGELSPLLSVLFDLIKELWPLIRGTLIVDLVVLTTLIASILGPLRGLTNTLKPLMITIGYIVEMVNNVIVTVKGVILGIFNFILGLITMDGARIVNGLEQIKAGILLMVQSLVEGIIKICIGTFYTILAFFTGWITTIIDLIVGLGETLVGHSVIPDILNSITRVISYFLDNTFRLWSAGWNLLVGVVSTVWQTITSIISTITSGISTMVSGWVTGLGTLIASIFNPIQAGIQLVNNVVAAGATGNTMSVNANGWNIYGGQGQSDIADQVYNVLTDVATTAVGAFSQWTRR